jgi:hypothetical protein
MPTNQAAVDEAESAQGSRERSSIGFPYGDLEDAISIAKAVHAVGGSSCQVEQLAAHLGMVPTGGAFRIKTVTAKIFGLTQYSQGTNTLTPLGQRIVDPKQERAARAEAFLLVPLYKAIYDKFRLTTLPPNPALENEMIGLGVAKKQADKARQTFQRSAEQAGFFAHGKERLVMPAMGPAPIIESDNRHDDHDDEPDQKQKTRDDGTSGGRHPFIAGLLKELPSEGDEWPTANRVKWLKAAAMIFDLIYKNEESGKPLRIDVSTDSAK